MSFDLKSARGAEAPPTRWAEIGPACLVTGGAGFLGRALVRALVERGCRVHALDVRPGPVGEESIRFFRGDIRDLDLVRRAAEGTSTVFHTAAVLNFLGVADRATRREVFGINIGGTRNVIRACLEQGVRRLVHTSTNSVCFDAGPVVDGTELRPYAERFIDIYAESKIPAEKAVLAADIEGGLRTVSLRPAGLWGPGPGCYMITKFVEELAKGKLVATVGDLKSLSDNTHVENLVFAELLAAEKLVLDPDAVGGQAYFVTDEEQLNLIEWFRPLIEGLGYRVPRRSVPVGVVYAAAWLSEWIHRLGGPRPFMTRLEVHNLTTSFTFRTDRARRELGYRPLVGHIEGLRACLPHCREVLERHREGRTA
jgi:3beta-hydroxy-delta5-steroid dehydrogenase/steroid delta-isomerase